MTFYGRIRIRIREKGPDPTGSGSATLLLEMQISNVHMMIFVAPRINIIALFSLEINILLTYLLTYLQSLPKVSPFHKNLLQILLSVFTSYNFTYRIHC